MSQGNTKAGSNSTLYRLVNEAKQYWLWFLFGIIGTILLSGIDASTAWLIKPIVDDGFSGKSHLFMMWAPLLVVGLFFMRGVAGFLSRYYTVRVARTVVMRFRQQIFAKLLRVPLTYYDQRNSGQILSSLIYNVDQVASASSDSLINLLRDSSFVIGLLVVMFVLNWQMSLFFIIVVPCIMFFVKKASQRLKKLSGNVQDSVGIVTRVCDQMIQAHKIVRICGRQEDELQKMRDATQYNRNQELKIEVTNSVNSAVVQLLMGLPLAAALFIAMQPIFHVTAGSFASIITSMLMLFRPCRRLTTLNSMLQKALLALRVFLRHWTKVRRWMLVNWSFHVLKVMCHFSMLIFSIKIQIN